MIHFSGIKPKKIDWKKIKASRTWRIVFALALPGVIYLSFILGYFSYLWAFLGIIFALLMNGFRLNYFIFIFLGVFILIPAPFLLLLGQSDSALQFCITAFIFWSIGMLWSFFLILIRPHSLHVNHPRTELFSEPFLKKINRFLLVFFGITFLFILSLKLVEDWSLDDSLFDQRIVIKNTTSFPHLGSDLKAQLEVEGFNNINLAAVSGSSGIETRESTFIFYREDKILGDYLLDLMPEPNRKVYVVRNPSLVARDVEIVLGNLQIQTLIAQELNIRILGTPTKERREEVLALLGEVEFIPMWNIRDYERGINDLLVDSRVPIILYEEDSYIAARQVQALFPESFLVNKKDQEWFQQSDEDVLILLR